jgi:tripartite-type tricarboxylate transporter receptor subunit TctC
MILAVFLFSGLIAAASFQPSAVAQPFPSKPVRIVLPYPVSGPSDIRGAPRLSRTDRVIARNAPPSISDVLAQIAIYSIQTETAQPVVLDRLPGATTARGTGAVARAPADGHTLLVASNGTIVINPEYFSGTDYDAARELIPVAPLVTMPFVLLARTGMPASSTGDLVAWLRRRPGEVNYGSSGEGSTGNLVGELFRRSARVNIVHVSFDGGVAALNGLAQGQVSFAFAAAPLALAHLPNTYFRPLAVSGAKRMERLPDVGTFSEAGWHGVEAEGWYAVFARRGTPPVVLAWLAERIASTINEPATRARVLAAGLEPATQSNDRFAARIRGEQEQWAPVLRESRLPGKVRSEG